MSVSAHPLERHQPGARAAGQRDAKALAQSHRDAIRRRTRRIRRSVAALAMTLFAVAFLVVYVQLASGHDPAGRARARFAGIAMNQPDKLRLRLPRAVAIDMKGNFFAGTH